MSWPYTSRSIPDPFRPGTTPSTTTVRPNAWHTVPIQASYSDMYGTAGFLAYLKRRNIQMYRYKVIASARDCKLWIKECNADEIMV